MIADVVILQLPKVSLQAKELLPEYSGIYYVLDETNKIWYIGQAKNIRKRWQGKTHHRIYQLEAQKKKHFTIYYEQVSVSQLDSIEKQRIEKYHPHLNASPVKTKKIRPTETLLRETLVAIADFAFILGVEPPRKEVESQIRNYWVKNVAKVFHLSVIHICLDDAALNAIYHPDSIEEKIAIEFKAFMSRKVYASQWEALSIGFEPFRKNSSSFNLMLRLLVNGYVIEVTSWNRWFLEKESEGVRKYIQTTLAQESIKALTPESLAQLQQQADEKNNLTFHLQRLNPYTLDPIKLFFDELVNREKIKKGLEKISSDYKAGRRGVGSRSEVTNIEELLISRGIDINKYSKGEVIYLSGIQERMGLYIQCFNISNEQKFPIANLAYGILDNKEIYTVSSQFDTFYLLAGVDKKAWLLVEEYLKDFAKPATKLKNGEGYVKKFYVSARKYIVPAKVSIKLEDIGYSAWIPFGLSREFPTFEAATKEIRRRLKDLDLPSLKVAFKRETIVK